MHFICRSFIGKPTDSSWSQYWENEPDDSSLIQKRGHLFGLLNLKLDTPGDELSTVGHDIIFEINQNYFSAENEDSLEASLKNALLSVTNNPLYKSKTIDLLIAVVHQNQIYFASFGSVNTILCRGNRVSLLLPENGELVKSISGPLLPEDKILILTSSFLEKITWEKIKSIISSNKVQNIEENFLSLLYSFDDQTSLAAAFIHPHSDEENPTSVPEEPVSEPSPKSSEPQLSNQSVISPSPFKKNKFSNLFSSFLDRRHKSPVYVSHHEIGQLNRRKKINFVVAIILISALFTSIYLGFKKNQEVQAEKQYQNLKNQLDQKFVDIAAVKNINIDSAREIAQESEILVEQMANLNIHPDDVTRYQSQIQQVLNQTGASSHYSPDLFYDTSISFKNASYSKMMIHNGQLYLLDKQNGRIDSIDLTKKNTKNYSENSKLKSVDLIAINKDDIYVGGEDTLYLVKNNSVDPKIVLSNQTLTSFKFWNGSAYILDNSNLTIWKITPNSTGFGNPQSWLKNDKKLDSGVSSFAINGRIWVITNTGEISPFASGIKEDFSVSQKQEFSHAKNLTVTLETDYLAFTDNDNLIYIYKKNGELKSKYNLNELKISDLSFDEENGFLYILGTDQKVYRQNF